MAVGVLGGCGQYFMTVSFKNAELGLVSPLKYLMIVIGGVLGYLFWAEVPDRFSVTGIVIIIACGVYTMHREAQLSRKPRQRQPGPDDHVAKAGKTISRVDQIGH
jgi:drug/metabolite transporter (DMT)-like permease